MQTILLDPDRAQSRRTEENAYFHSCVHESVCGRGTAFYKEPVSTPGTS